MVVFILEASPEYFVVVCIMCEATDWIKVLFVIQDLKEEHISSKSFDENSQYNALALVY